jgi:hypothetical protein
VRRNSEAEEVVLAKETRGGIDVFEIAGVAKFGRMKRLILGPVADFRNARQRGFNNASFSRAASKIPPRPK